MASDLLKVLREIRGTGAPEAEYTDGIYFDIIAKLTDEDNETVRLGAGIYGSIKEMYNLSGPLIPMTDELAALGAMTVELGSIYNDRVQLQSIYNSKSVLDSIFADKATLDSLYTDKATLDSLYADKAAFDVLIAEINAITTIATNINDVTNFADVYYGASAVEPTTRVSGDAMVTGDMYFDTSLNKTRYFNGTTWQDNPITLAEVTNTSLIGNPVTIPTLKEVYNHTYTSGIMVGCALTDNLDGTVDITTGEAFIRANTDTEGNGELFVAEVPTATALAVSDNATSTIYIDYNDGVTITWAATTTPAIVNMRDKVAAYSITREGNTLSIIDIRAQNVNRTGKEQVREFYTSPFIRKGGGIISAGTGLEIDVSAPSYFFQLKEYGGAAWNSATVMPFYRNVSGVLTTGTLTAINNTQYDNGTDLIALTVGWFTISWIYFRVGEAAEIVGIYGTAEFATEAEALDDLPPTLPASLAGHGVLLGRVITQEGGAVIIKIDNTDASLNTFSSGGTGDHENLSGITGGAPGEHNHLTNAELVTLQHITATQDVNLDTLVASVTGLLLTGEPV